MKIEFLQLSNLQGSKTDGFLGVNLIGLTKSTENHVPSFLTLNRNFYLSLLFSFIEFTVHIYAFHTYKE